MSGKTRIFVVSAAALGIVQLVSAGLEWHTTDAKLLLLYLVMAVLCSCVQIRNLSAGMAFSLNLPFVLLSIVQLSRPEAVVVGP
jgi:hypothetical protein